MMWMRPWLLAVWLLFGLTSAAFTQAPDPNQQLWDAAIKAATFGPAEIPLRDQATIALPDGMVFIPPAPASALMQQWGNAVDSGFQGLVVSTSPSELWAIAIDQTAEGYVKDEEAKSWDAESLLQSLRDGTEAQNEDRITRGIPAMDIVGWVQPPKYDSANHRLVWSIRAVDRGAAPGAEATINYNTYALGRDGYYELNLLTSEKTVAQDKLAAEKILSGFTYLPGKGYADFNGSTDRIAEYGIAALIAGVAAKKLGLLAIVGIFIAKFAKLALVGLAVAGGAIARLFRRNKTAT